MKKVLLLFSLMTTLIPFKSVLPQIIDGIGDNYILQVKGDTLVVKDYYDMGNVPNSLYKVLSMDTMNVPAGRVYELSSNGYYPLQNNPTTLRNTVIVGQDNRIVVKNSDAGSVPPLISGFVFEGGHSFAGIMAAHDITIKNCEITLELSSGNLGWSFIKADPNVKITLDNCLFERTMKEFVTVGENCNLTLRNCYFVNMSGHAFRRDGGVLDCFANMDTLLIENCTHVIAEGNLYGFRDNYQFKRIIINHNTFINCAGSVFQNSGNHSNISLTNNIFVNCNVQGFTGRIDNYEIGEVDPGGLAMGLVNVSQDGGFLSEYIHIYVDKNLIYWDSRFDDYISTLNINAVNGVTNWVNQMVTMNPRTQAMFEDNAMYPYLIEGVWYKKMPKFTDSKDLFTTQVEKLKSYALVIVDTSKYESWHSSGIPKWHLINTSSDKYIYPDWPIPVDLSYNDADILTAGIGGFPIGDLNWFPAKKAEWLVQKKIEYRQIHNILYGYDDVNDKVNIFTEFQLQQNYPNPFNPTTNISFTIPKAGHVTLKIYNTLGREISTLVDDFMYPQTYNVKFNGNGLASGIYFYSLKSGSFQDSKKMILMK